MEEGNILVSNNIVWIVPLLMICIGILFGMVTATRSTLHKLMDKYKNFMQGKDGNMEDLLNDTLAELRATKAELEALKQEHAKLEEQVQGCIQNIEISRYDAFDAMGGEMSYSILMTDAKKNGLILTGIYGRDASRTFAKDVKDGKSSYKLAEEEEALLK